MVLRVQDSNIRRRDVVPRSDTHASETRVFAYMAGTTRVNQEDRPRVPIMPVAGRLPPEHVTRRPTLHLHGGPCIISAEKARHDRGAAAGSLTRVRRNSSRSSPRRDRRVLADITRSTWNTGLSPRPHTSAVGGAPRSVPGSSSRPDGSEPSCCRHPSTMFHVEHAAHSSSSHVHPQPEHHIDPGRHNIPEQHESNTSCCRHPAHDVPRGSCYGLGGDHTSSVGPNP